MNQNICRIPIPSVWRAHSFRRWLSVLVVCVGQLLGFQLAHAQQTVSLAQTPLLALKTAPGLVMLTMSRDHRLFYAAYNDTSDIDGDGVVDIGFKPGITYYGNYVSDRCYEYVSTGTDSPLFRPRAMASATDGCLTAGFRWHGNWLNWATTSRMDALRRVLYGGYRQIDQTTNTSSSSNGVNFPYSTVLQGAFIPKDSHVFGKEFRPGRDTYKIANYTALAEPNSGRQHLFVVVKDGSNLTYPFKSATNAPVLRYILNADQTKERIWMWASADVAQGIGSNPANFVKGGGRTSVAATDLALRVLACVPIGGAYEANCTKYISGSTTVWKPTGVLHEYSVNDSLKFGLLTGSYQNNYSGGVVRRNIRSFKDEVDAATGQFSDDAGIARTIDRITIHGWNGSIYDCGFRATAQRPQGECKSWGAPVAEMMYEGLRYFAGKTSATNAFSNGVATGADSTIGFAAPPAWLNPYRAKADGGSPICSRPVQMVIADPLTSFDTDQVPGAYYSPAGGFGLPLDSFDLTGLNVATQVDQIWTSEGLGTRNVFIGQSGAVFDGNPTAKSASGFSQLAGHAPDETLSRGGYYAAGVSRFGRVDGIPVGAPTGYPVSVPAVPGTKVDTISLALGSLTPKIEIPNPLGGKITIVPVSKAVANAGINNAPGAYQATGAITGFYFDTYTPTSISAVVTFSDGDQGTDNETDALVRYDITLVGNTLSLKLTQMDPNPGGIQSNSGYVISGTGTTKDGLYLDTRSTTGNTPVIYYLDTLNGQDPKSAASPLNATLLPTFGGTPFTRAFALAAASSNVGGFIPHDPLWYAAKYGGSGDIANGDPTNYFKVSNPASLPAQMGKAFRSAAALAAVASTSVVGVGQRSLGTAAIYQANYDSLTWSSRLYAFSVLSSGTVSDATLWEASSLIKAPSLRTKLFLGRGGNSAPVPLTSGAVGFAALTTAEQTDFGSSLIYEYLLGDKTGEERQGGKFRNRGSTATADVGSLLGDVVNSDPQIISKKDYGYAVGDSSYTSFLATLTTESLAVGANDGFFHVFDAAPTTSGGGELLGFMPEAARTSIKDLSSPFYSHRFTVDGSIGLGHAKIAVPGDASTAWRSVIVAAGGAGAKTVFAINSTSQTYSANSILWEINENTVMPSGFGGTLGNVVGRPAIGKLRNGVWVAIFGNGYNSPASTANLFVVNLATGAILKIIPTNSTTANGLGSTEVVLKTGGFKDEIDYVYGADYRGNIWRFNLDSIAAPSTGWPSSGVLLYSTPSGRPITAEIKVGAATGTTSIAGGKMVYFGTGSYLNANDAVTISPNQALYGIYDDLFAMSNTVASVSESSLVGLTLTMPSATSDVRTSSTSATPWYSQTGKKGWVLALTGTNVTVGERVIAPPVRYTLAGKVDAFLFTSIVPGTDDCVAGVDAWITGVDAMTGSYAKVFDGVDQNSVKVTGGSPRGVFVLQDGGDPALYISQTIFNGNISTTSYTTSKGGQQSVTINGTVGQTRVLGIKLTKAPVATSVSRQVWRQLK